MGCRCQENKKRLAEALEKAKQDKLLSEEEIRNRDILSQAKIINELQEVLGLLEGRIGNA
jgi:uncharacterized membrane-anchored protein YjiN (DUF445 family)